MATNRVSRLFFILSIFSFFSTQTSEFSIPTNIAIDSDFFQAWETSYINHMNPTELQLLANTLHLLHALSVIEFKIRQFASPIARLNQSIRTNIDQYKNTAEDLATLKTLIDRLSFVASARTIYTQTLTTCVTHYNKNNSQLIDAALTSLQLYAQTILRTWADEQSPETNRLLKKSSVAIGDTVQHFQGVSNLHREMSEGKVPVEIPSEDEKNKQLIILSILLKNNPELLAVSEIVINSLNETTDHAAQIIHAGEEIYKQFYMILYKRITSPSFDKKYATTLFSMYDVLPDEYRSTLPGPDHVFEHMLQTTKLYTQTELS